MPSSVWDYTLPRQRREGFQGPYADKANGVTGFVLSPLLVECDSREAARERRWGKAVRARWSSI